MLFWSLSIFVQLRHFLWRQQKITCSISVVITVFGGIIIQIVLFFSALANFVFF